MSGAALSTPHSAPLTPPTKLSPPRVVGLMMGVWFLATAFGNKLAGWVASYFDVIPVAHLFGYVAAVTILAAVVLSAGVRPALGKLTVSRTTAAPSST